MIEKRCSCCRRMLPIGNFTKRNDRVNKTASHCRECIRARQNESGRTVPTYTEAQLRELNAPANTAFTRWRGPVSRGTFLQGVI